MWSWAETTFVPSCILIHPAVLPQQTWTENWGLLYPFLGELGPSLIQCGLGQGLPRTKWYLDSSSRLATINMGRKFGEGGSAPFLGRGTGSPSNTKSPGLRPSSISSGILILAAIWPQQIWTENWVGLCPFEKGGAGSPSNTMWPGPRSTCMPSFTLVRPTVWPQCTNVTDRTDKTVQTTV